MSESLPTKISPLIIVIGWLVFSVALAAWWVIFAYRFISVVISTQNVQSGQLEHLGGVQRMLVYEGISLILCLLAGGGALAYYVLREYRRNTQIQEFFAAFTHDLKTPIASLRLQAESLGEDLSDTGQAKLAKRLLGDTLRLELQLDNSLFLANLESLARLHLEEVQLSRVLDRISASWPELKVLCPKDCFLHVDPRAIETILKNLANNSLLHGSASELSFKASAESHGRVRILVEDNGKGFQGDLKRVGSLFASAGEQGGSGIGLHLVKSLTEKMQGSVIFANRLGQNGFSASFLFRGKIV